MKLANINFLLNADLGVRFSVDLLSRKFLLFHYSQYMYKFKVRVSLLINNVSFKIIFKGSYLPFLILRFAGFSNSVPIFTHIIRVQIWVGLFLEKVVNEILLLGVRNLLFLIRLFALSIIRFLNLLVIINNLIVL